jgi:pyruvate/2-oxoglutarate dehydrogenase complex dihydrolipoamide dehydrogenase (E3) component
LLENTQQILYRELPQDIEIVQKALERDGVKILTLARLLRVERNNETRILTVEQPNEEPRTLEVDAVLVAAGRLPNIENLGLDSAQVEVIARVGVRVNDRLQTTNPRIFAAGDVCSHERFTHAADAQARVAVTNALFFGRSKASRLLIPRCLYTDPELAGVGMNERDAHEAGVPVDTFVQEFKHVDRAILDGDADGFVKILVRKGSDHIVGATVVSRHAGDMIGEVALAMTGKLGLKTFSNTIHPYPTHAEALRKIGDAYNKTRLTPTGKWLFEKWFAWT